MWLALGTLLLTGCQLIFQLEDKPNTIELYNPVFVTSLTRTGNLGGVAGADELCRTAAETQEIEGTFVAWLSTDTTSAIDRLTAARGWVRVDGQPVADFPGDLGIKGPLVPIALTEGGDDVRGLPGAVFTGTQANGSSSGLTCTSWTSDDFMASVRLGDPAAGAGSFTDVASFDAAGCDSSNRIYCFGIDRVTPLEVTVDPLPIAFVSDGLWTPSSGRPVADSICRNDAMDARLDGTFLAAVALSTESIAMRFAEDREYMRPDGIRVGRVLSAELLDTFLNVTAEGKVVITGTTVWTGGSPGTMPVMTQTCGDWSTPGANGIVGALRDSDGRAFNVSTDGNCTVPERVYCLQN